MQSIAILWFAKCQYCSGGGESIHRLQIQLQKSFFLAKILQICRLQFQLLSKFCRFQPKSLQMLITNNNQLATFCHQLFNIQKQRIHYVAKPLMQSYELFISKNVVLWHPNNSSILHALMALAWIQHGLNIGNYVPESLNPLCCRL